MMSFEEVDVSQDIFVIIVCVISCSVNEYTSFAFVAEMSYAIYQNDLNPDFFFSMMVEK